MGGRGASSGSAGAMPIRIDKEKSKVELKIGGTTYRGRYYYKNDKLYFASNTWLDTTTLSKHKKEIEKKLKRLK